MSDQPFTPAEEVLVQLKSDDYAGVVAERDQLEEIVRELANKSTISYDYFSTGFAYQCVLCGACGYESNEVVHSVDCPYRIAREWVEAHK